MIEYPAVRYAPNGQPEVPVTGNVNHKRQVHPVATGVNPQRPVGVIRPANNQVVTLTDPID